MREINYTKSDDRIKKACQDAFNELRLNDYNFSSKLTIRDRIKLVTILNKAQTILGRL